MCPDDTGSVSRRLATILHDSNDAITMQDLEGRILAWNRGAERMYGYSEAEAIGMSIDALVPEQERPAARGFLEALRRGEPVASLEVQRVTRDGRVIDVWLTTTRLVDDDGRPVAVATTERDITRQKREARERERLVEELREAVQARDELLSIASHELKTPLTTLKLRLGLLLDEARMPSPDGDRLVRGIELAARQTGRLAQLIDELLDVTRITSGRLRLERQEVDLSRLVGDVVERHGETIQSTGCQLELRVQPSVVGSWDRLRLEQVLVNLLTNAVKHGEGSPVEITLDAAEPWATLVVRDRGPGIPEAEQRRIFERFVSAGARGSGGLGLGLYIARQIVEAHGGRIRVDSRPGEGAAFVVDLPWPGAPRPDEAAPG